MVVLSIYIDVKLEGVPGCDLVVLDLILWGR